MSPTEMRLRSINLNILECKACSASDVRPLTDRINLNILECKASRVQTSAPRRGGINLNILECKGPS